MCLTNFLPAKSAYKKAVCTSPIVFCQRHKPHNLQTCLPDTSACAKYNATGRFPSESENRTEKLPADVSQFHFRKAKWGFQGGEAPLASLGCARTGCIRCKMACHFAKLAYHPRHDYSGFWGVWIRGKQPLKERCFFRICPLKNLPNPPRGW